MATSVKPVIYQLVVRYFSNVNTLNQQDASRDGNGCGRFADITTTALAGIRQLGATHLWLTGCLRQATLTDYAALDMPADDPDVVKGVAGSLYAVRDYFDVCPDYAVEPARRMEEFEALVERAHAVGLRVLLDFVPNHVARGYRSLARPDLDFGRDDDQAHFFTPHNHFYYLVDPPGQRLRLSRQPHWNPPGYIFDGLYPREDGAPGRVPKVTGDNCTSASPTKDNWYETVKLNYGYDFTNGSLHEAPRPRTWEVMDEVLRFWQGKGVDGFRCDMAHMVPRPAWEYLIGAARARAARCFFLAEAYANSDPSNPIRNLDELLAAGFDAVYHSTAYDALKRIYQFGATLEDYDRSITSLSGKQRLGRLAYLENHDERRIGSPVTRSPSPGDSGFGSADAGYQLAPLQYLFSNGPVLFFNGQEVGEPGAGRSGYSSDDGRTTTFDYWCMPEFAKWVNGHRYDGGRLSTAQRELRRFYADLLALCQDPSIRAEGYWGLRYYNRATAFADCPDGLYTFARFAAEGRRLLLVAGCFDPAGLSGRVRIPVALADLVDLPAAVTIRLLLDRGGAKDVRLGRPSRQSLTSEGFAVTLPGQGAHVYEIA